MRTLILGFDAYDPRVFEGLHEQGRLPNLSRHVERGRYARLAVANPAQTEVSWTSIATGADPGGHGIFDFVHRDPATYTPYLSLLPTERGPFGLQFVPPHKTPTIFEEATRQGYPATALWWPATFPARPELPVRTVPGLGTPDIQGRWGVGTLLTMEPDPAGTECKTEIVRLEKRGAGKYVGRLGGPRQAKGGQEGQATIELALDLHDDGTARLAYGSESVELIAGKWSPILELSFRLGLLSRVSALTRVILVQAQPDVRLYALPLQLHPLHCPWRYASPGTYVRRLWARWGPFLTLGWPQDTTALEEGWITDEQFLELCEAVFALRERILLDQLASFDEGLLASVFDSLDRVQHMFRRDRPDVVEGWYAKLDALVGRVEERLAGLGGEPGRLIILSDHGFADMRHKVHLNRWLIDNGFLVANGANGLRDVDWAQSQAYAVGLNSLYLNLAGREGQGTVEASQRDGLNGRIRDALLAWRGPDGRPVVQSVVMQAEAFHGPLTAHGPDLVVGFSPGYRASAETGLGKWKEDAIEPNRDHWGADHCVDPEAVPGVLFCSDGLGDVPDPSFRDIPRLVIGSDLEGTASGAPPTISEEDEKTVKERLRGLGYL
jgi:predicted AlkP superfamily phosphohydrolase/phosphomutase